MQKATKAKRAGTASTGHLGSIIASIFVEDDGTKAQSVLEVEAIYLMHRWVCKKCGAVSKPEAVKRAIRDDINVHEWQILCATCSSCVMAEDIDEQHDDTGSQGA